MVGVFGTVLTILDPLGNLIKKWEGEWKYYLNYLIRLVKWRFSKKYQFISKPKVSSYIKMHKFISTHWISYEIERIVSMIYFSFIFLLLIFIAYDKNFFRDLENTHNNPQYISNILNIYFDYYFMILGGLIIIMVLLFYKIYRSITNIECQLKIIHTYFIIVEYLDQYKQVENYDILKEQSNNLLISINNKDWGTAKVFADTINRIRKQYHLPE